MRRHSVLLFFFILPLQESASRVRNKRTECDGGEFLTPISRIEQGLEEMKTELQHVLSKVETVHRSVEFNGNMLIHIRHKQRWYELCHSRGTICLNGGTCHIPDDVNIVVEDESIDDESYVCVCTEHWTGQHCEVAVTDNLGWYMEHGFQANQFKSKTAFFWAYPKRTAQRNDLMVVTINNHTCTAVHASFIMRHAARYTGVDNMRDFTKLHEKIKNAYGNQNYSFIDKWTNTYPEEKAESVTRLGEAEMEYLGNVYGNRLYDLLNSTFDNSVNFMDTLIFAATYKTRTQTSAKLFSSWLSAAVSGRTKSADEILIRNDVLRFYDNCMAYDIAIADKQEMNQFEHGPHFQRLIQNVVNRLELNGTLTIDEVKTLYVLCATELAVNNNPDWCTLLSDDDLEVLQYDSDIEDNINRLYGHPITGQMSCPLATDIFQTLDKVIYDYDTGQNYTKGKFQFGHSDTVLDFAAGLGLYKDHLPITAKNFEKLKHRKFKTAKVDPFSSHLAFILYNCGKTGSANYALRLLANGKPIEIPACNNDICNYQDVRQGYSHMVEGCDRDSLCSSGVSAENVVDVID